MRITLFNFSQRMAKTALTLAPNGLVLGIANNAAAKRISHYDKSKTNAAIDFATGVIASIGLFAGLCAMAANIYQFKVQLRNDYFRDKSLLDPETYGAISVFSFMGNITLKLTDAIASRYFSFYKSSKIKTILDKTRNLFFQIGKASTITSFLLSRTLAIHDIFQNNAKEIFIRRVNRYIGNDAFTLHPDSAKKAALVFQSTHEINLSAALTSRETIESLRSLAKHRDIQIIPFSRADQICSMFENASRIRPIQDVIFLAHGDDDKILLSQNETLISQTASKALSCLRNLPESGSIILYSCLTGNRIGKTIAAFTNRTVLAPRIPVTSASFNTDSSNRLLAIFSLFVRGIF